MLQKKYPAIKIYGKEISDGYQTPCFFTILLQKPYSYETRNYANGGFTVKIMYFQEKKNEYDMLKKVDEIKALFGMTLKVGERSVLIDEYEHEFIGQKLDIVQINMDYLYNENIHVPDTEEVADGFIFTLINEMEEEKNG
ncbi:MAG: hypothetical protein LBR68_03875 [Lachnoclostridium sp.]|nr:hypothetical protein [Lachnoclostridium sp.]